LAESGAVVVGAGSSLWKVLEAARTHVHVGGWTRRNLTFDIIESQFFYVAICSKLELSDQNIILVFKNVSGR
jgi:hypothetical protein